MQNHFLHAISREIRISLQYLQKRHFIAFAVLLVLNMSPRLMTKFMYHNEVELIPVFILIGTFLIDFIPIAFIIWYLRSRSPFWNAVVTFLATGPVNMLISDGLINSLDPELLLSPVFILLNVEFGLLLALIAFGAGLYPARRKTSLAIMAAGIVLFFATRPMVIWWLIMMPSFFGLMPPPDIIPPGNI